MQAPGSATPPEAPSCEVERNEKKHRFLRFYRGWRDFKNGHAIEPPTGWNPYSKELYSEGYDAARRSRDQ